MRGYFWSGYPYDNVCEVNGEKQYCNQDMLRSGIFPALPRFFPANVEWMSQSQKTLTSLLGYASLVMVVFAIIVALKEVLIASIEAIF
jgi:hypothetical protein